MWRGPLVSEGVRMMYPHNVMWIPARLPYDDLTDATISPDFSIKIRWTLSGIFNA